MSEAGGVVDHHVQATQCLRGGLYIGIDLGGVCQVARQCVHRGAMCCQCVCGLSKTGGIARANRNMRATTHEAFCDRQANATAAAGDQDTLRAYGGGRHGGRSIWKPALSDSRAMHGRCVYR